MVRRGLGLLLPLLLAGCPGEIGRGPTQVRASGLLAPTNLSVECDGGSRVVLRWEDRATTETGYRLEMAHDVGFMMTLQDVRLLGANETSYVYPTVPNETYFFRVFAITSSMESDPSNVAFASTPNVPVQPTGLVANPNTSSEIALAWPDVAGETGYVIQRSPDGGLTWKDVGSAPAEATAFVSGGLSPDAGYFHRIVAVNASGRSTASDPAFAQTTTASMFFFAPPIAGNVGRFVSYVVEPGGREHVAHYDLSNSNVLYTTRLAPAGYVTTTVDAGPTGFQDVGGDGTGIAVDPAGKVHIVAHDRTYDQLRYATNASGAWVASTLDPYPCGAKPRLVSARGSGVLHASYLASTGSSGGEIVRYARRFGTAVDLMGGTVLSAPGARPSLALRDGSPHPYLLAVEPSGQVRAFLGVFQGGFPPGVPLTLTWHPFQPLPSPLLSPQFGDTDLKADASEAIHVVVHERSTGALYYARTDWTTWEVEEVDSEPGRDLGAFCSLAIDPQTLRLHVAYYDATSRDLRYARKDPGGPWMRRIIEAVGDVGSHAAISIDGAGKVYIAYRDETRRSLRIAIGTP